MVSRPLGWTGGTPVLHFFCLVTASAVSAAAETAAAAASWAASSTSSATAASAAGATSAVSTLGRGHDLHCVPGRGQLGRLRLPGRRG